MGPKTVKALLNEFYLQLVNVNLALAALFNDGLERPIIDAKIQNLPIKWPTEAYEFFEWKNGLNGEKASGLTIGELQIIPLGFLSSLDTCIDAYQSHALKKDYWKKAMFPLFESGGGDYYLLDCEKNSETYRMIWLHMPTLVDFNGMVTKYDSLESLLLTTIECFNSKAYFYHRSDEDKTLGTLDFEVDRKSEIRIAKKYNPRSGYWKMFG